MKASEASLRTFIAIEVPQTIQVLIHQQQQWLETRLAAARQGGCITWTPPEKVHLTLRFLGETTDPQRQILTQTLVNLATQQTPFFLSIHEVGCFPQVRTPNIIWLGLQAAAEGLFPLQQQIEQLVQAAGFAAETKPFTPHLTIGRLRRPIARPQIKQIGQILAQARSDAASRSQHDRTFTVNQIVHIQSKLQPAGAVYTVLQTFPFRNVHPVEA